jgi:hypothetical protein
MTVIASGAGSCAEFVDPQGSWNFSDLRTGGTAAPQGF